MKKIAEFIVKYRKWMLILFLGLCAFSVWGMTQVEIEYSIEEYLPASTDTKRALDVMDKEFTTYGTATVMVRNVSFEKAKSLHDEIENLEGVKSFTFENTTDYYNKSCALFTITYDGTDEDEIAVDAYNKTLQILEDEDILISAPLVDTYADDLKRDVNFVLVVAVVIIVVVLALTSKSLGELPAYLLTFGVAALLNMGTNFFFGKISFISNSVCVILQLALAIDYAIILCQRFAEEKSHGLTAQEAMSEALAKAIPEIAGSSLTTISGLLALTTMALGLGRDMGLVLAKSIVMSMLTVFLFMPSVTLLFSKAIDKTTHKSLVPKITAIGKFGVKFRYVLIVVFFVLAIAGGVFSFKTEYVYSMNSIDTSRPSQTQVAKEEIESIFGNSNQLVILVPYGDYDLEKNILDTVDAHEQIDEALGISNVEITANGYKHTLTEPLNYKQFALLLGTDDDTASTIYSAYAFFSKDDAKDGVEELAIFRANKDIYTASILQMCDCAFSHDDFICAYLYDDADAMETYEDLRDEIQDAEKQLIGINYTRVLFNIDGDVESEQTFALLEELIKEVKGICPDAIFAGDTMSSYDLDSSFSTDNILVSVLTLVFVYVVLMFTFRSWGVPIPLAVTIQGAIFINFSYYALSGTNLFFFVYLIVSAIQMGATIDYAIVFTNRFRELSLTMDKKQAAIEALNQSFPTILTSGSILAIAGFLIGGIVSDPLIATLGLCLGRGVLISIASVLLVLPAMMCVCNKWLDKTVFKRRGGKLKERFLRRKVKADVSKEDDSATEVKNESDD